MTRTDSRVTPPEQEAALNLDTLQFEELGQTPTLGSSQEPIDSPPPVREPHSRRSGALAQREMHCNGFLSPPGTLNL